MKIKTCCIFFENLLSNQNGKGHSIIANYRFGRREFSLEARPFEAEEMESLRKISASGRNIIEDENGYPWLPVFLCR
jgi:hypothetical protein